MSLSRISELQYARRVQGEVNTHKYWLGQKDLEITLLDNLRGIADIDFYYDSEHNTTDYAIYLKEELDSSFYTGDDKR